MGHNGTMPARAPAHRSSTSATAELAGSVALGLLEHAPDAVLGIRADGTIALANARAEDLLGRKRSALVGSPVADVLPGELPAGGIVEKLARCKDRDLPVEVSISSLPVVDDPLLMCIVRDISTRRAMEDELRRSQERLAEAQQLARMGSWEWDIPADRVIWSDELFRIYGHEPGAFEPTYQRFLDHVHPDDREAVDQRNQKAFADHQPFEDVKRVLKADGTDFLMRTQGEVICDAAGSPIRMLGVCEDVTAEKRAAEAQALLAAIVRSSGDAIFARDRSGRITSWNPAAEALYGWGPEEVIGDSTVRLLPRGREDEDSEILARVLAGERVDHLETRRMRRDGIVLDVSLSVSPVQDADGEIVGVSAIARDITERKRFEQRLRWQADHDALTTLFNRQRFEQELAAHCARAARAPSPATLMLLDLDDFKYVNDTCGHAAGDEVLCSTARLLRDRLRSSDVLARQGGDEFAILLVGAREDEARRVATDLLEVIREHVTVIGGNRVRTSTSIGVVPLGEGIDAPEEILAAADRALYEAKDAGRDRFVVGTIEKPREGKRETRVGWDERIRQALDDELFVLHCQPIFDLTENRIAHYELLLRMREGDKLIPPAAFLGVAERLGLIRAIDRWVAGEAVRLLAAYPDAELAVNLSSRSVDDAEVPALIERELAAAGVDPTRLVIEITETAAIANLDDARRFADQLTALGCRFALDDFGTGFGSFSYLKHLPVDQLKIDGEFVRSPPSRVNDLIVESIVNVARGLGMRTIAEWVADDETIDRMRRAGVDCGQGFALGRPKPVEATLG